MVNDLQASTLVGVRADRVLSVPVIRLCANLWAVTLLHFCSPFPVATSLLT